MLSDIKTGTCVKFSLFTTIDVNKNKKVIVTRLINLIRITVHILQNSTYISYSTTSSQ